MPWLRRVVAGVAVAGVVLLAASFAARSPAPRRAAVASTSPADGATLTWAPPEVELAFTAAVDPDLSHVSVRDGSGAALDTGRPRLIRPDQLYQPIAVAAGEVTVAYHVTFRDGTDLSGTLHFTVTGGRAAGSAAGRPATDGEPAHQHGVDPVSAALLALDAAAVLVVSVLLLVRPRPARRAPGRQPPVP